MTDNTGTGNAAADQKAGWADLFRDGRGRYTILLNLGIGIHALDIFIITTVMPSVVDDIGGHAWYTWPTMTYMIGSIIGGACGFHMRMRLGQQRGYVWGGIVMLIGTIGCALPPDMATLLIARLIKGLGGGFVISYGQYGDTGGIFRNKLRIQLYMPGVDCKQICSGNSLNRIHESTKHS